ncbi:hypothetical protein Smp_151680 [Schistosoma mansoni]|uniref:hypothetical protein n=1 Tax=Schistosoma mansoni TaxID=6183 RepID=UPI0001A640C8|nr:hypothetical protein Smp_151680 [Schistosoma mansoni]|eukprot:XP_018647554.1 hypothetical protein Smp_151680 [Schistosoma mansoni]
MSHCVWITFLRNIQSLSSHINELIVNTMIPSRLRRLVDYSNFDPTISSTMNIFYKIRADRKGLITCEINLKEIDHHHSNKNMLNQTQSMINESVIEMKPTSTVYLICPQLSTSICYMDCSPNCLLNENGCTIPRSIAQVIEGCQFKRINASSLMNLTEDLKNDALDKKYFRLAQKQESQRLLDFKCK